MRRCRALLLTPLALCFHLAAAAAPTTGSVIEGHVLSAAGRRVPGALVRVTCGTGPVFETSTDPDGAFRLTGLPAGGAWMLTVTAGGYAARSNGPLDIETGATVHVDVSLAQQSAAESSPPGWPPEAGSATITRLDGAFVRSLPIIGHDYQDALPLLPGVDDADGDGRPSIRGSRSSDPAFHLDRADVTDPVAGGPGINLNPLVIESIEAFTAGAPADRGRGMGGFADVRTRSGGNDLEGALAVTWSGEELDGRGADNDDVLSFDEAEVDYDNWRAALGLGGPLVRDRAWYFASWESLDLERPADQLGTGRLITMEGDWLFGKIGWQPDPAHRLRLQAAADPRVTEGLGLTPLSSHDSGYALDERTMAAEVSWTATLTPDALLELTALRRDGDLTVDPQSPFFRRMIVQTQTLFGTAVTTYPCSFLNCSEAAGERSVFQFDGATGRTSGPFFQQGDETTLRQALRADLSMRPAGGGGTHRLRGGFELGEEQLERDLHLNPILYDFTSPVSINPSDPRVNGAQFLSTVAPSPVNRRASNFHSGLYLMDSWKPVPGLAIHAGLRFDSENLDASGFRMFDPQQERLRSIRLWRAMCGEIVQQGLNGIFSNCNPIRPYNGQHPIDWAGPLSAFRDDDMDGVNDVPPEVVALDLNGDGLIDGSGPEGQEIFKHFTTFAEREALNFEIDDAHLSPRIGLSWDPWGDGRTRLYAHWGRYHDRLRLETAIPDGEGAGVTFSFFPDPFTRVIAPGSLSSASTNPAIRQVSRDLRAPRTDELSLGVERSLGVQWTLGATWIRSRAYDLLQDRDVNHYTCRGAREAIGIEPLAVCGFMGQLEEDRFGNPSFPGFSLPNGIEDLYTQTPYFSQVLRVDNADRSDYRAWEVRAVRALHRSWQMQASYTWSEARGRADWFLSRLGDDPSTRSDEEGYLDQDQRHRIKIQALAHLPRGFGLAGIVTWASGTPWSVLRSDLPDIDSSDNVLLRTFYPTRQRNDQRNEAAWRIDGRLEKTFHLGRIDASGFLIVENILNEDTLTITSLDAGTGRLVASRDFGRRFELGATLGF